jgi:large subunit ribosomal protein L6
MSRIGKLPITIPQGVEVKVADDNTVSVKGPKGELTKKMHGDMLLSIENGVLTVKRPSDEKLHRSLHGLTRALLNNMVTGVTRGFEKGLELVGVGYRAAAQGNKLTLTVGYSQPVEIDAPTGIEVEVQGTNKIIIKGINKEMVGEFAAKVRKVRPPEPYKGKGIRYEGERVRRKEGKTGAK